MGTIASSKRLLSGASASIGSFTCKAGLVVGSKRFRSSGFRRTGTLTDTLSGFSIISFLTLKISCTRVEDTFSSNDTYRTILPQYRRYVRGVPSYDEGQVR